MAGDASLAISGRRWRTVGLAFGLVGQGLSKIQPHGNAACPAGGVLQILLLHDPVSGGRHALVEHVTGLGCQIGADLRPKAESLDSGRIRVWRRWRLGVSPACWETRLRATNACASWAGEVLAEAGHALLDGVRRSRVAQQLLGEARGALLTPASRCRSAAAGSARTRAPSKGWVPMSGAGRRRPPRSC